MSTYTRITCKSTQVIPGSLFVAIPGTNRNGAEFIPDAVARGVAAILVPSDQTLPEIPTSVQILRSSQIRKDYARLVAEFYGNPAKDLELYGITGTNGKTTTAWITAELLRACGHRVGLLTTVENSWGDYTAPAERTTASAEKLHEAFAAMRKAGCTAAVMEVSSHAIDQERVANIPFRALGFTNLTQDHLDYHLTMSNYFSAKRRLFTDTPLARAVVNIDDPYGKVLTESIPNKVIPYSLAGLQAIELTPNGIDFTLSSRRLHTALPGRYNLSNLLCAIGLVGEQLPLDRLAEVLPSLKPRWGRLERIDAHTPATLFVDYAHTPDALEKVLSTLRELNPNRLICLFGCGGDRDRTKRPLMAQAVATHADYAILTSDNPRTEEPLSIIEDARKGFPDGYTFAIEPDRRTAIQLALKIGQPGDIILLAGKGHESYQEIQGVKHPFDDRQLARELMP